jgi:hypothetical protein
VGSLPIGIPAGLFAPPAGMALPSLPAARPALDFFSAGSPGTPSTAAAHSIELFQRPAAGGVRGGGSLPLHLPRSGGRRAGGPVLARRCQHPMLGRFLASGCQH